jgi:hypothetical protein
MKRDHFGIIGLSFIILSFLSFAILAAFVPASIIYSNPPAYVKILDFGLSYWVREATLPPPLIVFGLIFCCLDIYIGWKNNEKASRAAKIGFFVGLIAIVFFGLMMLTALSTHMN